MSAVISQFVSELALLPTGTDATNMFEGEGPDAVRRRNLELYLTAMSQRAPRLLLLGEAPGYRGMRITGVPFTNRTLLDDGTGCFGLFGPDNGYTVPEDAAGVSPEPTATVMWDVLTRLDTLPLLWSAYPLHSHKAAIPLSNRTPSASDIAAGRPYWQRLRDIFEIERVVAVGAIAHRSMLQSTPAEDIVRVRHPAHGGKVEFMNGLRELIAS